MIRRKHILTALLASVLSVAAVSATAVSASAQVQNYGGRLDFQSQRSISPAEAKSIARKHVPGGEVVDIRRRGDTYSVRVIKKSGKVVDVLIDANTGRVK